MKRSSSSTLDDKDILNGVWLSRYRYTSSGRSGEFEAEHRVRLHRQGKQLVLESLPQGDQSSYLFVRLTLNDNGVATGSWEEATDPNDYYKGAVYYGAIQLTLDADHRKMQGKWVGFGKSQEVNSGPWEFIREDDAK